MGQLQQQCRTQPEVDVADRALKSSNALVQLSHRPAEHAPQAEEPMDPAECRLVQPLDNELGSVARCQVVGVVGLDAYLGAGISKLRFEQLDQLFIGQVGVLQEEAHAL